MIEAYFASKPSIQVNKIASSCEICSVSTTLNIALKTPSKLLLKWEVNRSLPTKGQEILMKLLVLGRINQTLIRHELKSSQVHKTAHSRHTLPMCYTDPSNINPNLKGYCLIFIFIKKDDCLVLGPNSSNNKMNKENKPKETMAVELKDHNRNLDVYYENTLEKESMAPEIIIEKEESSDLGDDIEKEGEWMVDEQPLDLVNMRHDVVYESLIEKMARCSLNFDFRIEKWDLSNLKIPCMIGRKFIANAYIDLDSPMNVMSLAYYNTIRNQGYEYRGHNFVGIGKDMHIFVGNISHVMDFTILKNVKANIDPSLS
uniref:Protein kinase-like domain, concanavalin A-like lectin/glucanase domain protein n=1 Tax=Tanacetum cinerariifolium TaxID=118510 RepID=A0A6L2JL95_TANCI|nr:protein kinase-like domain, concanavalin A-like lectin/glucanase domain protein [Tanacetum cinerariifolium]